MPMADAELSILIPTHDGQSRLAETLAAIARDEQLPARVEVVICDDGSSPPVEVEPLRRALADRAPLRLVRLDPNRGRAAACNAAAQAACGRVVLVLDDDMSLASGTLAGHLAAHPPDAPPQAVIARIDPDPRSFRGRFGLFLAKEEQRRQARLAASTALSFSDCLTGHFSIPRQSLLTAGGYSERFARYGFEDIELAWRLERHQLPLAYRDELRALHRSAAIAWRTHCLRHLDSGAMAQVFAAGVNDPQVRSFLRIDGMDPRREPRGFRRWMAHTHRVARRCPAPLAPLLLATARGAVRLLELGAPDRLLHAAYHLVRDMHYARGLAASVSAPPTRSGV